MKKISKIELENYRAYYDRLEFVLNKGENILLYGENGSGKTSLYKALDCFIQSFYAPVNYTHNRYKPAGALGEVVLSIGDYNPATGLVENARELKLASGVDNTAVEDTKDLKSLALTKGFLNYKDLLKMYIFEENNPNLFEFFVLNLLKNHVPMAQGQNYKLAERWKFVWNELTKVHNRNERKHKTGKRDLVDFESVLRSVLDDLVLEVNGFLGNYFKRFGLVIGYELMPMSMLYSRYIKDWKVKQDLRLRIELEHTAINDYNEGLNEARLSAIAICLYLAALKTNPGNELKLIFLDDIFIGIDTANRLPILEILDKEFSDYQILIATYDRSWYYMAKNYLMHHNPDRWRHFNLFSLSKEEGGLSFTVPVLSEGVTFFDHAKDYLHGNKDIDLPAAANYFRKTLEEMILRLPKELFLSDDYTVIPGFKLTQRVEAVRKWFALTGMNTSHINCIGTYLHPLIHPLSHFDDEAQIYRSELIKVEQAIQGLAEQLEQLPHKCKLLYGKGNDLCIQYNTADDVYKSNYFIALDDNLWLYKDNAGNAKFADCKCRIKYMDGEENGKALKPFIPSKKTHFNYTSLDDALLRIYDHEVNTMHHAVVACTDYDKVFYVKEMRVKTCIQIRRNELLAEM